MVNLYINNIKIIPIFIYNKLFALILYKKQKELYNILFILFVKVVIN